MANYAVIGRDEAAKQQGEIKPPTPPGAREVPEAPKSAAPGAHPAAPVESDSEALARWQGVPEVEANAPQGFSWKQDAFGRPVLIADPRGGARPAGGAAQSRTSGEPLEISAPRSERAQPEHPRGERKG